MASTSSSGSKEGHPQISVLILAASYDAESLSRTVAAGWSGYLRKSVERANLLRAVRAIAQGECVVDPELLRHLLHQATQQDGGRATTPAGRLTAPEREVIRKLEVSDRTQAAVKAVRLGLVEAAGHGSKR